MYFQRRQLFAESWNSIGCYLKQRMVMEGNFLPGLLIDKVAELSCLDGSGCYLKHC